MCHVSDIENKQDLTWRRKKTQAYIILQKYDIKCVLHNMMMIGILAEPQSGIEKSSWGKQTTCLREERRHILPSTSHYQHQYIIINNI